MRTFLTKLSGDTDEKHVKRLQPLVDDINALEPEIEQCSDTELREITAELRDRHQAGEPLDDLLVESFALTREAARRSIGQRHFDVQLVGGVVLHQGKIAEMKTGEGKTLTATLAVALNALTGRGVHLVTVNDYLAKRDTQWMGQIYHALGLSVACIQHDEAFMFDPAWESEDPRLANLRKLEHRREAYAADITFGTNNEFGFDYLRDNMVVSADQLVQRELHYAIVDEVDNILIDEARTPLIISGQAEQATDRYYQFAQIVKQLRPGHHFEVDLKHRSATLTETGIDKVEQLAGIPEGEGIYDDRYAELTHYLEQALRAEAVHELDKDYIVRDGEVIIIDEFTGRMMLGRRYSEGLHQAIEAKEGVRVQRQNVTMATITFQNYFRMYEKLAGMTGTAKTEAEEFLRIYNLSVVAVPTNQPMIRDDQGDLVFKNEQGKFDAVVAEIEEMGQLGRPVLVGTTSIETSERLSSLLHRHSIDHQVLNAKHHEREAAIVAGAGQPGMVTIATNMAGRGTDIKLGPGVAAAGGLHIVGTERHESRRIDNQLRGRSGRQGDPGSSRFYVSLEDELMRRFGSERIGGWMDRLGMEDDIPIEHRVISKSIESAQTKVEGHNFDLRKHVVQYDDVMNRHREVIYEDRRKIVAGEDISEKIQALIAAEMERLVAQHAGSRDDPTDYEGLLAAYQALIPVGHLTLDDLANLSTEDLNEALIEDGLRTYDEAAERHGAEIMRSLERYVMLTTIDRLWVEHLTTMDELRQGIGFQAYAQRDPLVAYKTEGYRMFAALQDHIQHDVVYATFRVQPVLVQKPVTTAVSERAEQPTNGQAGQPRRTRKVGANEPCPCGSGKKYKRCHGAPRTRKAATA